MDSNYDISYIQDENNEIAIIELTQSQYDQYKNEADQLNMDVHEYIQLAMEHEKIAEDLNQDRNS